LLELPAEIREQIWILAVTEWYPSTTTLQDHTGAEAACILQRAPIRMDRFNKPLPPAITRACIQTRAETLKLYYEQNIFECWRPLLLRNPDWSQSTFFDWLASLGNERTAWLTCIVLLYKHENELEIQMEEVLAELGFCLAPGVIANKLELSEYEMCFQELGLPRHFGKKKRWDRWLAGSSSSVTT